jgi:hypothetical protein
MTGKTWGQVHAERREKALAKLARGEKVSFSEQPLVKDELAAQRREVALAKLAAGERLSYSERGVVKEELVQKQQAETEDRAGTVRNPRSSADSAPPAPPSAPPAWPPARTCRHLERAHESPGSQDLEPSTPATRI